LHFFSLTAVTVRRIIRQPCNLTKAVVQVQETIFMVDLRNTICIKGYLWTERVAIAMQPAEIKIL